QGGLDKQLRIDSLQFVQSTNVDGIAIGGLSVGESKQDMYEVLDYLAPIYDENRPRYLMGVGDPPDLRHAFSRGIDMADCVIPSRNARHGSVWVDGDKKLNLKSAIHERSREPIEPGCACSTCTAGYSRGWLRHQFKVNDPVAGTLATIHNIHYLQEIAKSFR
ncbi:MAG: tRNA guanosine(34) transglycosylase Tgt, partial [Patescibacteria group bacterium]